MSPVRLTRFALLAAAPFFVLACTSSTDDGADPAVAESANTSKNPNNPNAPDARQSPQQTDQGCGGTSAPACDDGKKCAVGEDCKSLSCQAGVCAAATSTDGVANGDETDTDCGGATAPKCAAGKACAAADDCSSLVCTGNVCQAPTGTDGVKNGDESDVDCGGTTTGAPKCGVGKACSAHGDCASDGCGYAKKCVAGRSCTQRMGGDTCGSGEVGDPFAAHESCCATAGIAGSAAKVDKYLVTAGRMRAFIERTNGDVKSFVQGLGWTAAWKQLVPGNMAEADAMLGSYWFNAPNDSDVGTNAWSKRSCAPGVLRCARRPIVIAGIGPS